MTLGSTNTQGVSFWPQRLIWCLCCWFFCVVCLISCRSRPLPEQAASSPRVQVAPGIYHRVERGQTLWSIATTYGVDVKTLQQANRLENAHALRVGQKLYIPGATQARAVVSRCPCKSTLPEQSAAVQLVPSSPPAPLPRDMTDAASLHLLWPLQGTITQDFQPQGPSRHDGIDIAAPQGEAILAAADGTVMFSDWGPGGYGLIVILRHDADVITVYAHNHRNLVRAGQSVRQGEPIATVGRSGRATGYHLHFEVRRKTVPVSPLPFLSRPPHVAEVQSAPRRDL
jgi:lipoprotein NlpD